MQAVKPFNPCVDVLEDEQIPSKIWELLRRNGRFQANVKLLQKLDERARRETEKHHAIAGRLNRLAEEYRKAEDAKVTAGVLDKLRAQIREQEVKIRPVQNRPAWSRSCRLVEEAERRHPFAGAALQWLVPEPLLILTHHTAKANGKTTHKKKCFLSPADLDDPKKWPWKSARLHRHQSGTLVRGPMIHHFTSNLRRGRDLAVFLDEWRGWKPEKPMFDCDTPWPETPEGFRHWFQFIWRSHFDCRPKNPISCDRADSSAPHETDFFQDWSLRSLISRAKDEIRKANEWLKKAPFSSVPTNTGSMTSIPQAELELTETEKVRAFMFAELTSHYRLFAVPKTILTKGTANAMGDWLADELKKGSELYGNLLKGELLDEGELLGANSDWNAFLQHHSGKKLEPAPTGYFYSHSRYIKSLVHLIYPSFHVEKLLTRPSHRAHGKKYGRK